MCQPAEEHTTRKDDNNKNLAGGRKRELSRGESVCASQFLRVCVCMCVYRSVAPTHSEEHQKVQEA